jgi:hypothetical protein
MKKADCPGLLESVPNETIPMHGRMIHGQKHGNLFQEPQLYDVHGRVSQVSSPSEALVADCCSLFAPLIEQA